MIIRNALITSASIALENGILCCSLGFDTGSFHQCITIVLDTATKYDRREPTAGGLAYIQAVMQTVGVDRFEHLKGKYVRLRYETGKWNEEIHSFGHILDDKWLVASELFCRYAEMQR